MLTRLMLRRVSRLSWHAIGIVFWCEDHARPLVPVASLAYGALSRCEDVLIGRMHRQGASLDDIHRACCGLRRAEVISAIHRRGGEAQT